MKEAIVLTIACHPPLSNERTACYQAACQRFSEQTVLKTCEKLIAEGLMAYEARGRRPFRPDLMGHVTEVGRATLALAAGRQ